MSDGVTVIQEVCIEVRCGYVHFKYEESGDDVIPKSESHNCWKGELG